MLPSVGATFATSADDEVLFYRNSLTVTPSDLIKTFKNERTRVHYMHSLVPGGKNVYPLILVAP